MKKRVAFFVDGFNIYHAINSLGVEYYKWLDLCSLASSFIDPSRMNLESVSYFTSEPTHIRDRSVLDRHRAYTDALRSKGVRVILGSFKKADERCQVATCTHFDRHYTRNREKHTDVNIAIHMLQGAYENEYDVAYLISADSDLVPVVRMLTSPPLEKTIRVIAPPGTVHSKDLGSMVGKSNLKRIAKITLERCLLPDSIDLGGKLIVRPSKYDPPYTSL
jgi:uncharacterized LabA/DUF88 family protein